MPDKENTKFKSRLPIVLYVISIILIMIVMVILFIFKIFNLSVLLIVGGVIAGIGIIVGLVLFIRKRTGMAEIKEIEEVGIDKLEEKVINIFKIKHKIQPENLDYQVTHAGISSNSIAIFKCNDYWGNSDEIHYLIINLENTKWKTHLIKNSKNEEIFDQLLENAVEKISKRPTPVMLKKLRTISPSGNIVEETVVEPTQISEISKKEEKLSEEKFGGIK